MSITTDRLFDHIAPGCSITLTNRTQNRVIGHNINDMQMIMKLNHNLCNSNTKTTAENKSILGGYCCACVDLSRRFPLLSRIIALRSYTLLSCLLISRTYGSDGDGYSQERFLTVRFSLDFIDFETVLTAVPGAVLDFGDGGFRLMPIIPPHCHHEVTRCDKHLTPSEDMRLEWLGTTSPPTLWRIDQSLTRTSSGRRINRSRWPSRTSYITWRSMNWKHTSKQRTLNVLSIWCGRLYPVTYQMTRLKRIVTILEIPFPLYPWPC